VAVGHDVDAVVGDQQQSWSVRLITDRTGVIGSGDGVLGQDEHLGERKPQDRAQGNPFAQARVG
jgi:hypothetical protein